MRHVKQTIKVKRESYNESSDGSYGSYIQLTRTKGVKVLTSNGGCDTIKECKGSYSYDEAKLEASLLRKAYKSGVVPKVYGVRTVLINGEYYAGIVMQHLGDKTLSQTRLNSNRQYGIIDVLERKLAKAGIEHGDLHNRNVMVRGKKYYAIDFTPDYIDIIA